MVFDYCDNDNTFTTVRGIPIDSETGRYTPKIWLMTVVDGIESTKVFKYLTLALPTRGSPH